MKHYLPFFSNSWAESCHERLTVVAEGEIITAPNLNEAIYGGSAEISGKFTESSARFLASALENPLENPLGILQEGPARSGSGMTKIGQRTLAILGLVGVFLAIHMVRRRKNPPDAEGSGNPKY